MLAGIAARAAAYNPFSIRSVPRHASSTSWRGCSRSARSTRRRTTRAGSGLSRALPIYAVEQAFNVRLHAEYRGRDGAATGVRHVPRRDLHARLERLYDDRQRTNRKPRTRRCARRSLDYDRSYGYRGPEAFIEISGDPARARPAHRRRAGRGDRQSEPVPRRRDSRRRPKKRCRP